VPQLDHPQRWISAPHVLDELDFYLGMLVRMAMGALGVWMKGLNAAIIPRLPEVNVGAIFVILAACPCNAILSGVLH